MNRSRGALVALVALIISLLAPPALAAPTSTVLFVVDTSGSMYGEPLAQAKEALHMSVDALEPDQQAGLREFNGPCGAAGTSLVPIGLNNAIALHSAIDGLVAGGGTPTPDALRAAAAELPPSGARTIVLISDGQSSCGNPCDVAAELARSLGVEFKVHAVGFNAPEAAESELTCIAQATGGSYFSATNAEELVEAISGALAQENRLQLTAQIGDYPSAAALDTAAYIKVTVTARNSDGTPAANAKITASDSSVVHDSGQDGTVVLLERVGSLLGADAWGAPVTVRYTATHEGRTASVAPVLYTMTQVGRCEYEGKPDRLARLKGFLQFVLPTAPANQIGRYGEAIVNWVQAIGTAAEFVPARTIETTSVNAYSIEGENLHPIYALTITISHSATETEGATLFSYDRELIETVTGEAALAPLEAFAQSINCSGPAA